MMISEAVLVSIKCSATKENHDHFLYLPKSLSCGHMVCTSCVQNNLVTCNKCSKVNTLDLRAQPIIEMVNTLISENIESLKEFMQTKIKSFEDNFTGELQEVHDKLGKHFNFLEDEVEIYIESLKARLDEHGASFKLKLNQEKERLIKKFDDERDILENDIKFCKDHSENALFQSVTLEKFYECNKKLTNLNRKIDELKRSANVKMDFYGNDSFEICEESIGTLIFDHETIIDKLSNNIKQYNLDYKITSFVEIDNGNILIASYEDECLAVYDSNFNFIFKIDEIVNGTKLNPFCVCYDPKKKKIYITDETFIIKLNLDLHCLVTKEQASYKDYKDACFYNEKLFLCERSNSAIEIFSANLDPFAIHYSTLEPIQMKMIGNEICVQYENSIDFYRFQDLSFELINEFDKKSKKNVLLENSDRSSDNETEEIIEEDVNIDAEDIDQYIDVDDDAEDIGEDNDEQDDYSDDDDDNDYTDVDEDEDDVEDEDDDEDEEEVNEADAADDCDNVETNCNDMDNGSLIAHNHMFYVYGFDGSLTAFTRHGKFIKEQKLNEKLRPNETVDWYNICILGNNKLAIALDNKVSIVELN